MDDDRKRLIVYIIATLAILSLFVVIYWSANSEPELDERYSEVNKHVTEPGQWTPDLLQAYNDSQPLEFLEHRPFSGITINNEFMSVKKIVIIVIPECVESRASFATHTYIYTWEDEGVMVGNRTKSTTTESNMAYVFANTSVSNALYDRHKLFYNPALGPDGIEITMINLTSATFYDVEVE